MDTSLRHIILIGLPGSGKSTLGQKLARGLNLPFADLDKILETREGISVPEIFSQKGEDYFRKLEAACLAEFLDSVSTRHVLATGGGAPCFHSNMDLIKERGLSIYLEVPFAELAERLFAEGVEKRPLLNGVDSPEDLVNLLKEKFAYRIPYYQKADLHFRNSANAIDELLQEIQARL